MALYYNFAFAAKEEQPIWMVKLLVEGMKQQLRFLYPGGRGYPREQAESKAFTGFTDTGGEHGEGTKKRPAGERHTPTAPARADRAR